MIKFKRIISTIDAHTAGEPLRVITSGLPPIKGSTMLEKREYMLGHYDGIRKMLMLEPRGHSGMYGCIITEPVTEDGDFGVLFTHNEGLSTMCGHGIIGVTKVALETGMLGEEEGKRVVRIDSPAGRVTSYADVKGGRVEKVSFINVPSFIYAENVKTSMDGIGEIYVDVVFGGAFYVFVDSKKLGIGVKLENIEQLVKKGMELKFRIMEQMKIVHPFESGLNGIYGTIINEMQGNAGDRVISKNVCIFADGQIDRSPCGTGTAARVAQLYKRGYMDKGMVLINKSIIDTEFEGRIVSSAQIDQYEGVIPEISGTAHIMGFNQLVLDPDDPLPEGFRIIGG